MTTLLHSLGLPRTLSFHDVYSLTEPSLLSFLPRPAHALLLVFPVTSIYESFRAAEDSNLPDHTFPPRDGTEEEEEVIWFKQTIRNACGLIGLLHVACNGEPRRQIAPGSELDRLLREAVKLGPEARADLLYESKALEAAHADAAKLGDTRAPDAEQDVDLHFVAFVRVESRDGAGKGELWELDGRRKGPIKRGVLAEGEDVLSQTALELGPKAFLRREEEAPSTGEWGRGELRFSVVMLGPSLD